MTDFDENVTDMTNITEIEDKEYKKHYCYPCREGSFENTRQPKEETGEQEIESIILRKRMRIIFTCIRTFIAIGIFASLVYFDKIGYTYKDHHAKDVTNWMESRKYLDIVKDDVGKIMANVMKK